MASLPDDGTHRGTRAVQRLVEYAPSTGGLALWIAHCDIATTDGPLIATDGRTIEYAPAFGKLPLPAQAGLVAHEVLHVALRHPQRFADLRRLIGDADRELFNVCADAIVNSALGHLGWLALPPQAVTLERLLSETLGIRQPVEAALLEWNVERLYRAIDDRRENDPKREGSREDGPASSRARVLGAKDAIDLLIRPDTEGPPEGEAERSREWHERIARAHAGDGAHSLLRALLADLPVARTPWEQVLRTRLARGLAPRRELSWSRPSRSYIANQGRAGPNRRMPWEPGHSATRRVPRLAVLVDVSGSIETTLMDRFAREIEAITRRLEAGMVVVIGDDRVQHVEHFEPGRSDLRSVAFTGGGGTDFTPLLEEADRHRPDIAVFLTDLQGPARFQPRWPVIWAVPEANRDAPAPFGQKLVLV